MGNLELVEGVVEAPILLRLEVYQETMGLVLGPEEVPNGAEKMFALIQDFLQEDRVCGKEFWN